MSIATHQVLNERPSSQVESFVEPAYVLVDTEQWMNAIARELACVPTELEPAYQVVDTEQWLAAIAREIACVPQPVLARELVRREIALKFH